MFEISVSYPLAFAAGVVSFLSPCVLPVVPGYLTFVSGMTIDELRGGDARAARRPAACSARCSTRCSSGSASASSS